jgi:hypothetical protein
MSLIVGPTCHILNFILFPYHPVTFWTRCAGTASVRSRGCCRTSVGASPGSTRRENSCYSSHPPLSHVAPLTWDAGRSKRVHRRSHGLLCRTHVGIGGETRPRAWPRAFVHAARSGQGAHVRQPRRGWPMRGAPNDVVNVKSFDTLCAAAYVARRRDTKAKRASCIDTYIKFPRFYDPSPAPRSTGTL